ncbi:hypothetical protein FJ365_02110 [Candidatus Dependentiae bacterium]|nr:hypothetical protein [Candidatus Dependentiae bacterium]
MRYLVTILLISFASMSTVQAVDDAVGDQILVFMAECYKLMQALDALPAGIKYNIHPICSLCHKFTLAEYFAGMLAAKNNTKKTAVFKELLSKQGLAADELRQFFVELANETKEQCRSCIDGYQWY